jgi:hypothetical protein
MQTYRLRQIITNSMAERASGCSGREARAVGTDRQGAAKHAVDGGIAGGHAPKSKKTTKNLMVDFG